MDDPNTKKTADAVLNALEVIAQAPTSPSPVLQQGALMSGLEEIASAAIEELPTMDIAAIEAKYEKLMKPEVYEAWRKYTLPGLVQFAERQRAARKENSEN